MTRGSLFEQLHCNQIIPVDTATDSSTIFLQLVIAVDVPLVVWPWAVIRPPVKTTWLSSCNCYRVTETQVVTNSLSANVETIAHLQNSPQSLVATVATCEQKQQIKTSLAAVAVHNQHKSGKFYNVYITGCTKHKLHSVEPKWQTCTFFLS